MIDEPFGPAVPSVPLADSPLTFGRADSLPARGVHQRGAVHRTLQERIRPDYPDLKKEIETQVVVGPDSAHAA